MKNKNINTVMLMMSGIIGCILMGSGDWLMIYGDTAYAGNLAWLTTGAAHIEPWKNSLAMVLAFPAVLFYIGGLLGIKNFMKDEKHKKIYSVLTAAGLTPWLCLHLLYVMILFLFGWLNNNGYADIAVKTSEAVFSQFSWIIFAGEAIMLLPFIYLIYVFGSGRTAFSKWMAVNNPLIIYIFLKCGTMLMKDNAVRLAFTNGLMSESMLVWFAVFIISFICINKKEKI